MCDNSQPRVLGVTRMTVLWPLGLSEHLDDDQLYPVMLHEVSHARRRDNLLPMAHMVVEAAFWFYPVVWWVGARLVDARESACDDDEIAVALLTVVIPVAAGHAVGLLI